MFVSKKSDCPKEHGEPEKYIAHMFIVPEYQREEKGKAGVTRKKQIATKGELAKEESGDGDYGVWWGEMGEYDEERTDKKEEGDTLGIGGNILRPEQKKYSHKIP